MVIFFLPLASCITKRSDNSYVPLNSSRSQGGTSTVSSSEALMDAGFNDSKSTPKPTVSMPQYPMARPVPGKPGFVFSPYSSKVVDVKGIASGSAVYDPTTGGKFVVP